MLKRTDISKILRIPVMLLLLLVEGAFACTVVTVYKYEKVPSSFTAVFYHDEAPIRNAKVTLYLQRSQQPPVALRTYATDASGQVAISDLQPGLYIVSVTDDDLEQSVGVEVVAGGKELQTQVVSRYSTPPPPKLREPIPVKRLQGVVLDTSGAVIRRVKIHIKPESAQDFRESDVVSSELGRFTAAVPEGRYLLMLQSPGFSEVKVPLEVSEKNPNAWVGVAALCNSQHVGDFLTLIAIRHRR